MNTSSSTIRRGVPAAQKGDAQLRGYNAQRNDNTRIVVALSFCLITIGASSVFVDPESDRIGNPFGFSGRKAPG